MVKIVDVAVLLDRAECVELHLRVTLGRDRDALAVLQVNDLENAIADDDHIPRSESVFDPAAEVQPLFDEGCAVCFVDLLDAEIHVLTDVLPHLGGVERIMSDAVNTECQTVLGYLTEPVPDPRLCECVGKCPLLCSFARLVRERLFKAGRWRT